MAPPRRCCVMNISATKTFIFEEISGLSFTWPTINTSAKLWKYLFFWCGLNLAQYQGLFSKQKQQWYEKLSLKCLQCQYILLKQYLANGIKEVHNVNFGEAVVRKSHSALRQDVLGYQTGQLTPKTTASNGVLREVQKWLNGEYNFVFMAQRNFSLWWYLW